MGRLCAAAADWRPVHVAAGGSCDRCALRRMACASGNLRFCPLPIDRKPAGIGRRWRHAKMLLDKGLECRRIGEAMLLAGRDVLQGEAPGDDVPPAVLLRPAAQDKSTACSGAFLLHSESLCAKLSV